MFLKSATAGVDEEFDLDLASEIKEQERREKSINFVEEKSE